MPSQRPSGPARRKKRDEADREKVPARAPRAGDVAIVGRPNVGKSTFLNAALAVDLAITSKTPQTTRTTLLGIIHREVEGAAVELRLVDTPGIHEAHGKATALNQRMNRLARASFADTDVVVLMTDFDATRKVLAPHPADVALAKQLPADARVVLVVNKVDRIKDKARLLTLLEAFARVRAFESIVPISALRDDGVDRVLDEVGKLLPEAEHRHGEDDLTDKPMRFFAAEFVREQVLRRAREEVPHATAVTVESFEETARSARIQATIHVEKLGQKKILVGEHGSMLKSIGTEARLKIAELLGKPVHLELFVRETPNWRDRPTMLDEIGIEEPAREDRRS